MIEGRKPEPTVDFINSVGKVPSNAIYFCPNMVFRSDGPSVHPREGTAQRAPRVAHCSRVEENKELLWLAEFAGIAVAFPYATQHCKIEPCYSRCYPVATEVHNP